MKKVKKIFAVILSLAMILGMSISTFAAPQNDDGIPRKGDTVDVTITNIKEGASVTLYKIVKANYAANGIGITGYTPVNGVTLDDLKEGTDTPSSVTIMDIANKIAAGTIEPLVTYTDGTLKVDGATYTYTKNVEAGVYIAIINKSTDGTVYNPILLTAAYAPTAAGDVSLSELVGGTVDTANKYMRGETAVAKSTEPKFDKKISGAVEDGKEADGKTRLTASLGDVITFTLDEIVVPTYPSNAENKTFFFADTMDPGFTFDYSSLNITLTNGNESAPAIKRDGDEFKLVDGTVVAKAADKTANGQGSFNLSFIYNSLLIPNGNGAVYTPVITYNAVVNEHATIGKDPNTNTAHMYYANTPNDGKYYDTPEETPDPQTDSSISEKHDTEKLYTYRLAFLKTDDATVNPKPLAGAVFGVYDKDKKLVDVVTTNEKGYAETIVVSAGTYTVKELVAPEGYALNETEYKIVAKWDTVTTKITGELSMREYTSQADESLDGVQVGWLKDNTFYAMSEFSAEGNGVSKAYIKQTATTKLSDEVTVEKNQEAGTGVALRADAIPNTKLASLPSTGGIGTTIFTIGGCAIMIIAAGLFFASRRKSTNAK